ncbi:hypothetical protein [Streptomyces sp. RB17]|uniref:hypothetical protein n=1 Tax=Streptomyces sp. RB17 TaxID=2585197 RepID=UPI001298097F|nr:hypothetical protein [Streptomyces sp. RB17]
MRERERWAAYLGLALTSVSGFVSVAVAAGIASVDGILSLLSGGTALVLTSVSAWATRRRERQQPPSPDDD